MDKNSSTYVVVFAASVCIVMAAGLAGTFNALKTRIDGNILFDKQRNVLIACGLYDPATDNLGEAELKKMFQDKVDAKVLEFQKETVQKEVRVRGELKKVPEERFAGAKPTEIKLAELAKARRDNPEKIYGEIYVAKSGGGNIYCMPISGKGLWSTLYGFLALDSDRNTVRGITFYAHGETPGLGGEVEQTWWTAGWKGKKIHGPDGKLVSIKVLKGRGNDTSDMPHAVDGISGATITSDGVTKFVKEDLKKYDSYFKGL